MKKNQINNAFYDDLEDWYGQENHPIALLRAENRVRNPWIQEVIALKLGASACILDIGCGGGMLTNFLAQQGHSVFGIDLSANSLKNAQRMDTTQTVSYQKANAYALPFPEKKFDVVCAMDVLEHVEDCERLIKEASRVLKKGGLFFFHTFNRNVLSWLMVIKGVEWCVPNTPMNMHVYSLFLKPAELRSMCLRHGLKTEEMKGLNPDMRCAQFWKMVFFRKASCKIRFKFNHSLLSGYCGFSTKEK